METVKYEYEEWVSKYHPIVNNDGIFEPYEGYFFDTTSEDLEKVRMAGKKHIWTLVDCENEEYYIIPGFRLVNREGYFITDMEWEDENIEVNLNEMITAGKAKYLCIEFLEELGIPEDLWEDKIHDFFANNI